MLICVFMVLGLFSGENLRNGWRINALRSLRVISSQIISNTPRLIIQTNDLYNSSKASTINNINNGVLLMGDGFIRRGRGDESSSVSEDRFDRLCNA
jgi:hypothetical protein